MVGILVLRVCLQLFAALFVRRCVDLVVFVLLWIWWFGVYCSLFASYCCLCALLVLIARFCIEVGGGWWFGGDLD